MVTLKSSREPASGRKAIHHEFRNGCKRPLPMGPNRSRLRGQCRASFWGENLARGLPLCFRFVNHVKISPSSETSGFLKIARSSARKGRLLTSRRKTGPRRFRNRGEGGWVGLMVRSSYPGWLSRPFVYQAGVGSLNLPGLECRDRCFPAHRPPVAPPPTPNVTPSWQKPPRKSAKPRHP